MTVMPHRWKQIALATCEAHRNLTNEDRLLMQHLRTMGFPTKPTVWTACDDCRETLVVVRSCWDYHLQPIRFLEWTEAVTQQGGQVVNSPAAIRWNHDKRYLRELQACGVQLPPTVWVEPENERSLEQIAQERGWDEIVVKPAISATAWKTVRIARQHVPQYEGMFREIVQSGCALVQKFMKDVSSGEWSFIFFNGMYSHAVLKRASQADFRVQHEFGGTIDREACPHPSLIDAASIALQECPVGSPLYARVDGIETGRPQVADSLLIMEIELIEPALFLEPGDGTVARFAEAIATRMNTD